MITNNPKPSPTYSEDRFIRLIVHLQDTPHNRNIIDTIEAMAASTTVQGLCSCIKKEEMQIIALHAARSLRDQPPTS